MRVSSVKRMRSLGVALAVEPATGVVDRAALRVALAEVIFGAISRVEVTGAVLRVVIHRLVLRLLDRADLVR